MPRFGRLSTCGRTLLELLSPALADILSFKELATPNLAVHLQLRKLC